MLEEVNNIKGLEIYTPKGIFVGYADEVILDVNDRRVIGILVKKASPVLVDNNVSIQIPFRWIQCIGDIIILKVFPEHVNSDGTLTEA